jgi:hypothetical protein
MAVTQALNITELAANQTSKELTINNALDKLSAATQKVSAINFTGNAYTLSLDEFTYSFCFVPTGVTAAATMTVPLTYRVFAVDNRANAFQVTVKGATGAAAVVGANTAALIFCNGALCFGLSSGAGGGSTTPRDKGALLAQWSTGAVVTNGTFYFVWKAPYAGTITSMDYAVGTGSFSLQVLINGVLVTGLAYLVMSPTTGANIAATGANTFAAGATISGIISGTSGTVTGVVLELNVNWA